VIVKQLEVGLLDVFAYIIGCEKTKKAIVVDPGGNAKQIADLAKKSGLSITFIVNTHSHFDHTTGNSRLSRITGAEIIKREDRRIDREKVIYVGEIELKIYHTPGHSPDGICLYAEGQLFTGDTLFVGTSGRTDLSGGDRPALAKSIRELMTLSDDTVVWPGHDYGPSKSSTIGWEKRNNKNAREYGYYVGGSR
jgi:glyoxylase-like metal-dependent hydrolase (beta-lactamase superfamily II)